MDENRISGNTTVAPDVIETIIKMTVGEVDGISKIFTSSSNSGVKLKIADGIVNADVYVVLNGRNKAMEVGKKLQDKISRAISEMVGMEVGNINIHIEDFDYSSAKETK